MTPLPIPVPPQLEEAVGLPPTEARWISLFWTSCGDTVVYDDGRLNGTGHGWGFLAYIRHATVAPHVSSFDFGSSEMEGPHRLLIDAQARLAYVADTTETRHVLKAQWPAEEGGPVVLSPEEWDALVERVRALAFRPMPTGAELLRQMRQHSRIVGEMVKWLDQRLAKREEKP